MRPDKLRDLIKTVWSLFKGNLNYRFSVNLVRCGVALMLGPPVIVLLINRMLGQLPGATDSKVDDGIAIASFVAGCALVIYGVWSFRASQGYPDTFSVAFAKGETFESASRKITDLEEKGLALQGFEGSDYQRHLTETKLEGENAIEVLKALRTIVRQPSSFPEYDVIEEGAAIIVRKK